MNKSPLTTILLTILAFSAIFSVVMCYMYISRARELTQMNLQVAGIQSNRQRAQGLLQETDEYRKKNPSPALDAMINAATGQQKGTSAPPTKPTTK